MLQKISDQTGANTKLLEKIVDLSGKMEKYQQQQVNLASGASSLVGAAGAGAGAGAALTSAKKQRRDAIVIQSDTRDRLKQAIGRLYDKNNMMPSTRQIVESMGGRFDVFQDVRRYQEKYITRNLAQLQAEGWMSERAKQERQQQQEREQQPGAIATLFSRGRAATAFAALGVATSVLANGSGQIGTNMDVYNATMNASLQAYGGLTGVGLTGAFGFAQGATALWNGAANWINGLMRGGAG